MGTLVFQANLGGAVNLVGPNTASTVNFTLPSADGTNGQALVTNGTGTLSCASVTTAAGGSNTQVQFNSSGAFAGSANLTFDGTTLTSNALTVTNATTLSAGTANGVAYLNGSKVVTTGSALSFNGSALTVNSTAPGIAINDSTPTNGVSFSWLNGGSNYSYGQIALRDTTNSKTAYTYFAGASGYHNWYQNGTEGMRLTSTGLGIGTTSPGQKLEVAGTTSNTFVKNTTTTAANGFNASSTGGNFYFGIDDSAGGFYNTGTAYGRALYSSGAYPMVFFTNATERARIDSSGNLLMGTTSLMAGGINKFQISDSANAGMTLGISGTSKAYVYASSSGSNLRMETVSGYTIACISSTNGVSLANGATSWAAISDERKKDIIEPITNAAQKVAALRAVIGKYKTDSENTRRSFLIAQDVQAVLPEAIDATNPEELRLQYTDTIPLLVAAIQEQQALITQFTARIAALEAK